MFLIFHQTFARSFVAVFEESVLDSLKTCYKSLCEHQTDLSPFKENLEDANRKFPLEWGMHWQHFFLKQLLNLVEKLLADKEWMEVRSHDIFYISCAGIVCS